MIKKNLPARRMDFKVKLFLYLLLGGFGLWLYGVFLAPFRIRTIVLFSSLFLIYLLFSIDVINGILKGRAVILFPDRKRKHYYTEISSKDGKLLFYLFALFDLIFIFLVFRAISPPLLAAVASGYFSFIKKALFLNYDMSAWIWFVLAANFFAGLIKNFFK